MHVSKCFKSAIKLFFGVIFLSGTFAPSQLGSQNHSIPLSPYIEPWDAHTLTTLKALYEHLIAAENRHDLAAVKQLVWDSPSTLFVAKTATPAEGNWAGFWGSDIVMQHFHDLYQQTSGSIQTIPKKKSSDLQSTSLKPTCR